jgi:hypothetical protein
VPEAELEQAASTTPSTSLPARPALTMPVRVRVSLTLLLAAWVNSVALILVINHVLKVPIPSLAARISLLGLTVQVVGFYLIGVGNNATRIVAIFLLLAGVPSLYYEVHIMSSLPPWWVSFSVGGHAIKCVAIALLFGGIAGRWFRRTPPSPGMDANAGDIAPAPTRNIRRWPPIAVVTLLLSGFCVIASSFTLFQQMSRFIQTQEVREMQRTIELAIYAGTWLAMSAVALYTVLCRPSWGRHSSMCFALWIGVGFLLTAIVPNTLPSSTINDTAEAAGELVGRALVVASAMAYLLFMAFGSNARSCFTTTKSRRTLTQ